MCNFCSRYMERVLFRAKIGMVRGKGRIEPRDGQGAATLYGEALLYCIERNLI